MAVIDLLKDKINGGTHMFGSESNPRYGLSSLTNDFTFEEWALYFDGSLTGKFDVSVDADGNPLAEIREDRGDYRVAFEQIAMREIIAKDFTNLNIDQIRLTVQQDAVGALNYLQSTKPDLVKKALANLTEGDSVLTALYDGFLSSNFNEDVSVEINKRFRSGGTVQLYKLPTFVKVGDSAPTAGQGYNPDAATAPSLNTYAIEGGFSVGGGSVELEPSLYNSIKEAYLTQNGSDITVADTRVNLDEDLQIGGDLSKNTTAFSYNENRYTNLLGRLVDFYLDYKTPAGIFKTNYTNFLVATLGSTADTAGTTIEANYRAQVESTVQDIIFYLSYDFESARRINLVEAARNAPEGATAEDILEAAERAALEELSSLAGEGVIPSASDTPIDPEEIEKFFEQCTLMATMADHKEIFKQIIKDAAPSSDPTDTAEDAPLEKENMHDPLPYQERFYMVEVPAGQNDRLVNFLNAPRGNLVNDFLNLTPDIQAFLTPKIRLYKVFNDGPSLKQVEFLFNNNTGNTSAIKQLFRDNDKFFRGSGYGIKDFSVSFEGTTPATAKNDIVANLTLFFQDFSDFVAPVETDQGTFSFIDLIFYDKKNSNSPTYGYGASHPDQYSPAYYRIRADIGWRVPENHPQFDDACRKRGIDPENVRKAIRKTNKAFYLNMVEHDLNFKKDGTVEIKAQYRGYVESVLKGTEMDALVDQSIIDDRKARAASLLDAQKTCNPGQMARIKRIYSAEEEKLIENLYQNTFKRLLELKKVRTMFVESDGGFRVSGFFEKKPILFDEGVSETGAPSGAETFSYFFLGDLFYVMLDVLYAKTDNGAYKATPLQNTKFILPTIEFENFFDEEGMFAINLAQIPIAHRYFDEWFTENVIKPKRKTYSIMFYLRDLLNNLIADALVDTCLNKDYRKSFNFQTTTVNASDDPLAGKSIGFENGVIMLEESDLPFTVYEETDINDITNFVLIYAAYSTTQPNGLGDYSTDIKNGVYHFHLGQDRGIVHDVKFSKVDMAYIREARYMREGVDGLLQLGAVYRANINMFGNTLFYPGMQLYINPFGIGGEDFMPNKEGTKANSLGLGGYHIIEKVNSSIAGGIFKTSIDAMFVYSGDGETRFNIQGKQEKNEEENLERPSSTNPTCNERIASTEADARTLLRTGESGDRADSLAQETTGSPLADPYADTSGDKDGDGIPDSIDLFPDDPLNQGGN